MTKRIKSHPAPAAKPYPVFITREEAAAILRVKPATLANWANTGNGPGYRPGRPTLYDEAEVYAYALQGWRAA